MSTSGISSLNAAGELVAEAAAPALADLPLPFWPAFARRPSTTRDSRSSTSPADTTVSQRKAGSRSRSPENALWAHWVSADMSSRILLSAALSNSQTTTAASNAGRPISNASVTGLIAAPGAEAAVYTTDQSELVNGRDSAGPPPWPLLATVPELPEMVRTSAKIGRAACRERGEEGVGVG